MEQREYFGPFGRLSVVDADSAKTGTQEREPAELRWGHRNHVGEDAAVFDLLAPHATRLAKAPPGQLSLEANAEFSALARGDHSGVFRKICFTDVRCGD